MSSPMMHCDLRLAWLSARVAFRSAGPVPWILAVSLVLIASLQEPTLLRSYEVQLVNQSALGVGVVLSAVLASSLRAPPRVLPHVLAVTVLVTTVFSSLFVLALVADLGQGLTSNWAEVFPRIITAVIIILPVIVYWHIATRASNLLILASTSLLWLVSVVLTVQTCCTHVWSWSQFIASIASFVSATTLTHIYCRRKI